MATNVCLISRPKLTDSLVTGNTYCHAVLGRQRSVVVRLILMPGLSLFWNIPGFALHLLGSNVVALRLWSCMFVMLLTLGAKALPHTHSAHRAVPSSLWLPIWCRTAPASPGLLITNVDFGNGRSCTQSIYKFCWYFFSMRQPRNDSLMRHAINQLCDAITRDNAKKKKCFTVGHF